MQAQVEERAHFAKNKVFALAESVCTGAKQPGYLVLCGWGGSGAADERVEGDQGEQESGRLHHAVREGRVAQVSKTALEKSFGSSNESIRGQPFKEGLQEALTVRRRGIESGVRAKSRDYQPHRIVFVDTAASDRNGKAPAKRKSIAALETAIGCIKGYCNFVAERLPASVAPSAEGSKNHRTRLNAARRNPKAPDVKSRCSQRHPTLALD